MWISTVAKGANMGFLKAGLLFLRAMLLPKAYLACENLALRQPLAVRNQSAKRPKLRPRDRVFWVCLSTLWPHWRHRAAQNGHQVASHGIQAVLAVEVEAQKTWASTHRTGNPRPDSPYVPGELDLGRTADRIRTGTVGPRRRRRDRDLPCPVRLHRAPSRPLPGKIPTANASSASCAENV